MQSIIAVINHFTLLIFINVHIHRYFFRAVNVVRYTYLYRYYPKTTKAHRIRLARAFKHVPQVDLSIECAIEGQMGRAFVDDLQEPTVFKIEVGPFFYFAGDGTGPGRRTMLENIVPYTLFMPSSPGWIEAGKTMYGERLVGFDRYSFSSEHISAEHLDDLCQVVRGYGQRTHRPIDKQFYAAVAVDVRGIVPTRYGQPPNLYQALGTDVEPRTRSNQYGDLGRLLKYLQDKARARDEVLKVVQDEEALPGTHAFEHLGLGILLA